MRFERLTSGNPQQKTERKKIIFEEVSEPETGRKKEEPVADFTFREDPVEMMVRDILSLEQRVADAKRNSGNDRTGKLEIAQTLLAKKRYEQAVYNERQGRSKEGEADRLLDEWQSAQDRLDNLRNEQVEAARRKAVGAIDADTAAQLRRHRSPNP
jgi:hypothetical protein